MATWYLMNNILVGTTQLYAGALLDDVQDPVTDIRTAGGVLMPSATPGLATAAGLATHAKARGAGEQCESIMNAALDKAQQDFDLVTLAAVTGAALIGSNAAGYVSATVAAQLAEVMALAAANMAVVKRTVTINYAVGGDNFAALGAGTKTFSKNLGAVLPANARLVGWSLGSTITPFDDATHGDFGIEIGTAGTAALVATSTSIKAGATGFPKTGTAGAGGFIMNSLTALQMVAKITSSVDLNTATAGSIVVNLFYIVLA